MGAAGTCFGDGVTFPWFGANRDEDGAVLTELTLFTALALTAGCGLTGDGLAGDGFTTLDFLAAGSSSEESDDESDEEDSAFLFGNLEAGTVLGGIVGSLAGALGAGLGAAFSTTFWFVALTADPFEATLVVGASSEDVSDELESDDDWTTFFAGSLLLAIVNDKCWL